MNLLLLGIEANLELIKKDKYKVMDKNVFVDLKLDIRSFKKKLFSTTKLIIKDLILFCFG